MKTNNEWHIPTMETGCDLKDGISEDQWYRIHSIVRALASTEHFKESCEIHEALDFLRKVLILCCAFAGTEVSKPMFAAFVSLMFAFLHIRAWPYQAYETNVHKALSDFRK
eukprot:COSAG05_NODE_673_length_7989_cov_2.973638_6_plen_111_part_00